MSSNHEAVELPNIHIDTVLQGLEKVAPFPFGDPDTEYDGLVEGFTDVFAVQPTAPPSSKTNLYTLIGPSGVGQDTIMSAVQRQGFEYARVRNATTRFPRDGDSHDAYVWMDGDVSTPEALAELVMRHELVEYQFHSGALYGTPLSSIKEAQAAHPDLPLLTKNDPGGVKMLRREAADQLDVICIALMPAGYAQLWQRIGNRSARLQRMFDAAAYAVEVPYITNYAIRNVAHDENQQLGIDKTAEQLGRLITMLHAQRTGVSK